MAAAAAAATPSSSSAAAAAAAGDILKFADDALAAELATSTSSGAADGGEAFVLFLGSKAGGKSSLVSAFLNPSREEVPRPTVGLEYTFGRRAAASSSTTTSPSSTGGKEVAHVWELGGNSVALADLLGIVITPARLPGNVVVYVADLSRPAAALASAVKWLGLLRARVAAVSDKLAKAARGAAGGGALGDAQRCATARLRLGWACRSGAAVTMPSTTTAAAAGGESEEAAAGSSASTGTPVTCVTPAVAAHLLRALPEHPDAAALGTTLLPLQLVVVGAKFDALRDADSPKRKAVLAALRYLALMHGGAAVTTTTRDKATLGAFRSLVGAAVFGTDVRRTPATDINKPLYVPAGADSLEAIGLPLAVPGAGPVTRSDLESGPFEAPPAAGAAGGGGADAGWPGGDADDDIDVDTLLPPLSDIAAKGVPVVFKDEAAAFPEPLIDMMRVAKAEETARYAQDQERRLMLESKSGGAADGPQPPGR